MKGFFLQKSKNIIRFYQGKPQLRHRNPCFLSVRRVFHYSYQKHQVVVNIVLLSISLNTPFDFIVFNFDVNLFQMCRLIVSEIISSPCLTSRVDRIGKYGLFSRVDRIGKYSISSLKGELNKYMLKFSLQDNIIDKYKMILCQNAF